MKVIDGTQIEQVIDLQSDGESRQDVVRNDRCQKGLIGLWCQCSCQMLSKVCVGDRICTQTLSEELTTFGLSSKQARFWC